MKTGSLTFKYHIISVYMREKNLSEGIWHSFIFKMQEHCCNNKSLFYCRVLSSDMLVVVVRQPQVVADSSGIREVLCSYHKIKEQLRLEGASGDHVVHPHAKSRVE